MDFVHLHNHTHYSLLDAAATVDDLINAAVEKGHKALAITDHGVMFGALEFYQKAKAKGIKPIIGFEAYLSTGSRFDKSSGKRDSKKKNYYHLTLLAKNYRGYKNLIKLTTYAHLEGFYYKPRIDKELLEKYSEGLVVCSGCLNGVVNSHIIAGEIEKARQQAKYFKDLFGEDFYIEIQNHYLPEDEEILKYAPQIARELGIKLVATNDIHYIRREHAIAHNVYLSIRKASENPDEPIDITKLRYRSPELYYKSTAEMKELFKDFPEAITNTVEVAEKCDLQLQHAIHMPEFEIPSDSKDKSLDDYLKTKTYEGLKRRYGKLTDEITQRADFELNVIQKMKFSGYFLIVADFVEAARNLGIRVGPGRGSAAGSIVAYALGITNIDPLQWGLLFERFLNPDRVSLPDIDIDFCDVKRNKIIEYVKSKYGENSVAQIITFGKLSSRAVLKDVGRILGIHHTEINKITSKIPVVMGKVKSLSEALELPDLKYLKESKDEKIQKLIEYSLFLEGLYRHTSVHAAGVVIAPGDVSDYVPLYLQSSDDEDQVAEVTTQYSMNDLEFAGLIKMDFLGLKTLSILDNTLEMVEKNYNAKIDLDSIPLDDGPTYKIFENGQTLGVFQFESSGMQEYLRQLKPTNILELSDMNALYRPGPMANIPEYIDRKFGRKEITYLHPLMEGTLKQTYGIIVYQEQVMQLARDIAGFSLAEADNLRRAMGKKKQDVMEKLKPAFIEGAKKNSIDEKLAIEIYELIERFANYGFNKSHSLAYSLLAYQTAYLKAHYPAEFLAASMNAEINNTSKIAEFIEEARNLGIKVIPPDVNRCFAKFVAVGSNTILFGLAGIKNVGERVEETIVGARKEKPFTSFFNFVSRIDPKVINRKILEALVAAGAFDSIENGRRAALNTAIDVALEFSRKIHDSDSATENLFGGSQEIENLIVEPELPMVEEWSIKEKLAKEKEFLGFYLSGHPLDNYRNTIKILSDDLPKICAKTGLYDIRLCGIIYQVSTKVDRNNSKYCFLTLEIFNKKIECNVWSETYARYFPLIYEDNIVCIKGKCEVREDGTCKVTVNEIYTLEEAINKFVEGIHIFIKNSNDNIEKIERFAKLCVHPESKKKITFIVNGNGNRRGYLAEEVKLKLDESIIGQLFEIFGENNLKFV